jgi:hypothetical protein
MEAGSEAVLVHIEVLLSLTVAPVRIRSECDQNVIRLASLIANREALKRVNGLRDLVSEVQDVTLPRAVSLLAEKTLGEEEDMLRAQARRKRSARQHIVGTWHAYERTYNKQDVGAHSGVVLRPCMSMGH